MPANGARMIVSSMLLPQGDLPAPPPPPRPAALPAAPRATSSSRLGAVELGLAGDSCPARARSARSQLELGLARCAPGSPRSALAAADRACASARRRLRLDVRCVQPRQHLPRLDLHALLDEHLDHLAGDLGGNRRLAPRGDVAGGVEHRGRAAGVARHLDRRRRGHQWRPRAQQPGGAGGDDQRGEQQPGPQPASGAALLAAVDAQVLETGAAGLRRGGARLGGGVAGGALGHDGPLGVQRAHHAERYGRAGRRPREYRPTAASGRRAAAREPRRGLVGRPPTLSDDSSRPHRPVSASTGAAS